MNPRRKKRLVFASALIGGVAAIASLLIYALNSNLDLFFTATEVVQGRQDGLKPEVGQRIRIGGMVVEGSVERDPNSLKIAFQVADTGPAVTVLYDGMLPDLFREGQGIVAQGTLVDSTTLEASEVLAKHDENYMSPEIAEAMGKSHEQMEYSESQTGGGY
ncbi:CcmE/CycJ protein [Ferrimonas balearica DSM 9799]|uniref:Cytochrome c-type biogenesis protein CcmE n=1 Tax=Ferrimonas balearica (strain DSM 9799 / CCM 4581 / KCTC 23876 / PAT) TaxID=550540 RepID=E1SMF5_FERBD|nr:cytochrome c maturation protein CcmE [Ferrimonas balearica]MBY6019882.1 cytochrome c maturation protein CcmE [Halomonas denitrificans]ADN74510.1 CcmE/CycJ protein [Ferrimonas balearica DSM 9799]MBW3141659.1 cytochrome c maturation protein CcmE [Ferrimonas balearica]MBW3166653.1 cytochrome c maturation protein CcmE [Ferrimonas balearica]MBY5982391.1 cytochrome c maturation protein CcmE [Ferrimonas balearica]